MVKCDGTVLVVEVDPSVRTTAVAMPQDLGFQVIPAEGGQEALRILANANIEVLFSDILMPGEVMVSAWRARYAQ